MKKQTSTAEPTIEPGGDSPRSGAASGSAMLLPCAKDVCQHLEQARSEVGAVFESQFADEEAMKSALAFYADYDESLWEEADSVAVGKSPVVHRKAISGTCHPREVARKALLGKCK